MIKKSISSRVKWMLVPLLVCVALLPLLPLVGCTPKSDHEPEPVDVEPVPVVPALATKADLDALQLLVDELASDLDELDTKVVELARENSDNLNDLRKDMSDMSTSGGVSQSVFNQFSDSTNNSISSINSKISAAQDDISTLKSAVAALNTGSSSSDGDVDPEDAVELETRYFPLYSVKAGATALSIPIRIRAENVLAIDIEEVELGVEVRVSDDDIDFDKVTMSGGGITWSGYGSGGTWSFVNWTDVDFDAGERKTFDPILKITFEVSAPTDADITVNIDSFCDDYRVKD